MYRISTLFAVILVLVACSTQQSSDTGRTAVGATAVPATPTVAVQVAPPAPSATATTAPPAAAAPTRDQRLADMFSKSDWPAFIQELEPDQQRGTLAPAYSSSLYAAYVNQGTALLAAGNRDGARTNANKARQLDPSRGEAPALLLQIDPPPTATSAPTRPTPTPVPPTVAPTQRV